MKKPTWNHPDLGSFTFDQWAWVAIVDAPAFNAFAFAYDSEGGKLAVKYELAFEAEGDKDIPSPAALELAAKVLTNQADLVPKVTNALWDDFNGRGPNSGMWWHNDLAQVSEEMKWWFPQPRPLTGPDDLLAAMQLSSIVVRKSVYEYDEPIVELGFSAPFEDEHGVGVLTDGRSVLGIGYSCDVTPFETG
ncbi:MAG TPA: hypothetical protein VJ783_15355 [Pirellulales bacterium]|nr:hypothetical protein [Pirellulales bacterium]